MRKHSITTLLAFAMGVVLMGCSGDGEPSAKGSMASDLEAASKNAPKEPEGSKRSDRNKVNKALGETQAPKTDESGQN